MVKEMVMLVRRVNCFEVVRIKKVQFFAKKGGSENIFQNRKNCKPFLVVIEWVILKGFDRRFSIKV